MNDTLPEGFVIDSPETTNGGAYSALPEGFVIDTKPQLPADFGTPTPEPSVLEDLGTSALNVGAGALQGIAGATGNLLNVPADVAQTLEQYVPMGSIHPSALWDKDQPFYTSEVQPQDFQRVPTDYSQALGGYGYEPMSDITQGITSYALAPELGASRITAPIVKGAVGSFAGLDPEADTILDAIGPDVIAKQEKDSPLVKRMKNAADSVVIDSVLGATPALNKYFNTKRYEKARKAAFSLGKQEEEAAQVGKQMYETSNDPFISPIERKLQKAEGEVLMKDPLSQISEETLVSHPDLTIGNLVDLKHRVKNAVTINKKGGKIGVARLKEVSLTKPELYKALGMDETLLEKAGGYINKKIGNTFSEILGIREAGILDSRVNAFDDLIKGFKPSSKNQDLYLAVKARDFDAADKIIAKSSNKYMPGNLRNEFEELKGFNNYGRKVITDKADQNQILDAIGKISGYVRPLVALGTGHGALELGRYAVSKWNTATIGDRVKLINAALNNGSITPELLEGRVGSFLLKPTVRTGVHGTTNIGDEEYE